VIDNFEQLLGAAGEVARVLNVSPRSKIVVTSRAALRLGAEHELALGALAREPAAALFIRRARAVDPRLKLDDAPEIAEICASSTVCRWRSSSPRRASRSSPPRRSSTASSRRLDLLSAGPRDAPARQQTLRARSAGATTCSTPEPSAVRAARRVRRRLHARAAEAVCGPRRSTASPRSPTRAC
jgi:hypothetical protein